MKAQVFTTTRSASSGRAGRRQAVGHQGARELVRVDLVLRAAQGLQPVRPHPCAPLLAAPTDTIVPSGRTAGRCPLPPGPGAGARRAGQAAEREGFEPSDPVSPVNSLAVSPIRPLSHLSTWGFMFPGLHPPQEIGRTKQPNPTGRPLWEVPVGSGRECAPNRSGASQATSGLSSQFNGAVWFVHCWPSQYRCRPAAWSGNQPGGTWGAGEAAAAAG